MRKSLTGARLFGKVRPGREVTPTRTPVARVWPEAWIGDLPASERRAIARAEDLDRMGSLAPMVRRTF
jgi:hypothetical protein